MRLSPLPDLVLYGRADCGLCDETRTFLMELLSARREAGLATPELIERNIESDASWEREFFASIPVVELGDRRIELATSPARVQRLLTDVLGA